MHTDRTDRPSFFSPLLLPRSCYPHYMRAVWPGSRSVCFFSVAESSLGVSRAVAGLHMVHEFAIRPFHFGQTERHAAAADRWSLKLLILEFSDFFSRCVSLLTSVNGEIENSPKHQTENKKTSTLDRDSLFPYRTVSRLQRFALEYFCTARQESQDRIPKQTSSLQLHVLAQHRNHGYCCCRRPGRRQGHQGPHVRAAGRP